MRVRNIVRKNSLNGYDVCTVLGIQNPEPNVMNYSVTHLSSSLNLSSLVQKSSWPASTTGLKGFQLLESGQRNEKL
jgi:hypothetical protein